MKRVIYKGNVFDGWNDAADMLADFQADKSVLKDAKVLYALREFGDYDGWCFVLFKRAGKLYEVNGSHCSCYGLEGQWEPEETLVEALYKSKPEYAEMLFGPAKK
jgi:hypothetical protein